MNLKKIILKAISIISIVVIVLAVILLVFVLISKKTGGQPSIFGYTTFRVLTGSMETEIPTGSMIFVKQCDASEVEVNDVISFYSSDPSLEGAVNTHRVVEIQGEGDSLQFITKGDANLLVDEYPVAASNVVGKVVGHSVFVGWLSGLASKPYVFFPIIIVPLAIIFGINIFDTVKLGKQVAKEEEAAELEKVVEALKKRKEDIEKLKAEVEAEEAAQAQAGADSSGAGEARLPEEADGAKQDSEEEKQAEPASEAEKPEA